MYCPPYEIMVANPSKMIYYYITTRNGLDLYLIDTMSF